MNIQFQHAVDRFVGVPIRALLSLLARLGRRPRATPVPSRLLVILLSEMGSLVLAQPMFLRLKQQHPGVSIYALVFGRNREVPDLLDVLLRENILVLNDRSLRGFVSDAFRVLCALRALKLDVVQIAPEQVLAKNRVILCQPQIRPA